MSSVDEDCIQRPALDEGITASHLGGIPAVLGHLLGTARKTAPCLRDSDPEIKSAETWNGGCLIRWLVCLRPIRSLLEAEPSFPAPCLDDPVSSACCRVVDAMTRRWVCHSFRCNVSCGLHRDTVDFRDSPPPGPLLPCSPAPLDGMAGV